LIYDEGVWAIVGAPDGPSAHLVEQLAAKARVPFVSTVSTDKTVNLANVAWVFSCAPGDHLIAPVWARAIVAAADGGGIIVVAATDHDSRMATKELLTALNKLQTFPTHRLEFSPGSSQFSMQIAAIDAAQPAVAALIAGPLDSARFVQALRRACLTTIVFGGPNVGRRSFIGASAPAPGLRFPLLWHERMAGDMSGDFAARFTERYGDAPDYTAAYTYDGVKLLVAAIHQAGLNRARIRDAIRKLSPWEGVTGRITWDPTGQNTRGVWLATIHRGQVIPLPSQ
jgi:branched-chain amino acid transport system substrate-binding protein